MRTVEVGGNQYNIGKMDVFKQLQVGRRIAPLYVLFSELAVSGKADEKNAMESDVFRTALASGILRLPDTDFDLVMNECLAVCERQQATGWAKVKAPGGPVMFQDLQVPDILQLMMKVIEDNLGAFFPIAAPR
jgi:hypothetical protein